MHLPARRLFFIAFALYTVTAWRSEGYHHPDEHFQILELANHRLGRTPEADLPWEFAAQIRPGLQPMLACGLIRLAEVAGLDDPFAQAFLLRLVSGWLCLWLFFLWADRLETRTGDQRLGHWLRLAAAFLWFVPYLSVRFSSENWAGLALGFGLLLLLFPTKGTRQRLFSAETVRFAVAGFLLALSFFFRFQMGFALAGLGAWWVWQVQRKNPVHQFWDSLPPLLAGGLAAVALGVWSDAWLYGKLVFTAYNYFEANILHNMAANWGTSPWWFYFFQSLLTPVPPISVVLLGLLFLGMWRERADALAWCLMPFLLAHIAVGHKEMRFLYPMLLPVLVLAVLGLRAWVWRTTAQIHRKGAETRRASQSLAFKKIKPPRPLVSAVNLNMPGRVADRVVRIVWWTAVAVNFLLLPVRSLLAAQESVPYFRFLYAFAAEHAETTVVFSQEKSLYHVAGLNVHFYRSPLIRDRVVEKFEADTLLAATEPNRLILWPKLTLQGTLPGLRTERLYTYFPDWLLRFNPNDWQGRSRIWSVYRYEQ
ncbi:MAG: hypothetical protein ABMA02_19325 [Saprospiraceae bacterium]